MIVRFHDGSCNFVQLSSHSNFVAHTYCVPGHVYAVRRLHTTVEPSVVIDLEILVWYTWMAKLSPDHRMVARPKFESHDVAGQSIDAVGREIVLFLSDRYRVHGDLVLYGRRRSCIYSTCRTVGGITRGWGAEER